MKDEFVITPLNGSFDMYDYKMQQIIDGMNTQLMDNYLIIGIICLACAAWNMSKYSKIDHFIVSFINGFINMVAFGAGVAAIGYYAISKGWM